jgi:diaminohydroxyphosphoribosylaminopyrimidine deaminase / 5-amino-6-(5-phosphoribosylamino)uracil reductase
MSFTAEDTAHMRRALKLAARGFTPPNPMVGCVIVKHGKRVGQGYHPIVGQPHAEVFALRDAGEEARGADAYVTLEPCCHYGRTGPCTEALIQGGIRRVVVAAEDVDPRVAGKGIARLREAGIIVESGLLAEESVVLNEAFFHFHTTHTPFVTLKAAMSLDGKIAAHTGASRWITGEKARRHVHALRARAGAVMAGIGTVLADDPLLDARLTPSPPRQPLRVVVDSNLRLPVNSRLAASAEPARPLIVLTTGNASETSEAALQREGLEVVRLPDIGGKVDLCAAMRFLASRSIISVFCEGGGELNAGLVEAGIAHRALFFVAPVLIGGKDAPTPLEGCGANKPAEGWPLNRLQVQRYGDDIAITARINAEAGRAEQPRG